MQATLKYKFSWTKQTKAGEVPSLLKTGNMTLIDKVKDKQPLTVSSIFLSVIQYGFRSERSTTDCVFLILAVIREERQNHRTISIAFCDLAKAYDSV